MSLLFFQFLFLTHSVNVIRQQDHLERPKQIAHFLLNSFVFSRAETTLTNVVSKLHRIASCGRGPIIGSFKQRRV